MQAIELSPTTQVVPPGIPGAGPGAGGRIPSLDGVRGFAIILVLLWHYVATELTYQPGSGLNFVRHILGACWSGVDLFFVLSGFLLGGILIENRNSPNYFRTFYLRRACRIFPLYYAWLFAVVCARHFLGSGKLFPLFANFGSPWPFFTYTQNITPVLFPHTGGGPVLGVTWSLAVEEQFYLILPFIIYFVPPKRLLGCLLLFIVSSTVFRLAAWYWAPSQGWAGYVLLPCRWDSLFLGVLGAWLTRQPGFMGWLRNNRWVFYGLMFVIGVTITILGVENQGNLMYFGMHMLGFLCLAIFYLCLILLVVENKEGWLAKLFSLRWLCGLGVISYGVYIFHEPVSSLLHTLAGNARPEMLNWRGVEVTVAALVVTVSMAAVSWKIFESRLVSWGRRHKY